VVPLGAGLKYKAIKCNKVHSVKFEWKVMSGVISNPWNFERARGWVLADERKGFSEKGNFSSTTTVAAIEKTVEELYMQWDGKPWISQLPDLSLTSRVAQKKEEGETEAIKG
jgi:hypothetical protein